MRLEHLLSGGVPCGSAFPLWLRPLVRGGDILPAVRAIWRGARASWRSALLLVCSGGLAQLARAPALQAGGQRFESVILHCRAAWHLSFVTFHLPFSVAHRSLTCWHKQDCKVKNRRCACRAQRPAASPWGFAADVMTAESMAIAPCFPRGASVGRKKGRMADALAHGGDEGRDKLR